MGRNYDLTEVQEQQWIYEAGKFTVKVTGVSQGKTQNLNDVEKVIFSDKNGLSISDEFVITDKALYRMKNFVKALKLEMTTNTDDWVGRYVVINVVAENYPKTNGGFGIKFVIKSYEDSSLTTPLGNSNQKPAQQDHRAYRDAPKPVPDPRSLPEIDIDEDEIPF